MGMSLAPQERQSVPVLVSARSLQVAIVRPFPKPHARTVRYVELDRNGPFWREEAPKKAAKRSLDVASAFAGLLIYDVLCLTAARRILEGFDARGGCVPGGCRR